MDEVDARQARWVLHVDMDAFFASCEQLTRPTLRGRPVLVGGVGGRGVVAGCSYEARARGAHSAMPMHQARRLVGASAVVLPPRMALYRELSHRVFAVFRERVPVVEQVSVDEAFLEPAELAGASAGECARWAEDLRAAVRERTGLACSVGAGAGKQYAKIASGLAKPDGVRVIPRAAHDEALHPLPVGRLWGVGPVAAARLAELGLVTIGDLAAADDADVLRALGSAAGTSALHAARGFDEREVAERAEAKQISAESTFAADLTTPEEVAAAIRRSAGHVHPRLVADGRYARTVTVKVKRSDFQSISRSVTLPQATVSLGEIVAAALSVAPDPREFGAVRLVGVGVSGLVTTAQGVLFGEDDADAEIAEPSEPAEPATSAEPAEPADLDPPAGDPAVVAALASIPGTRYESPPETWRAGADVRHSELGHGWVQGCGHGRVSVRFETAASGPGPARTFAADDPQLSAADPLDALAP